MVSVPAEVSPAPKPETVKRPVERSWLGLADTGLVLSFLALAFLLGCFPMKDTDFWWHLAAGNWVRANGTVPKTDLFTFSVPDHPWVDLHWSFQVMISWTYENFGIVVLNLAKCAVTCLALLMLITARRPGWPVWVMTLAWLPALFVLSGRMYVRPETISLVYLSAYLAVLFRWRERPWLAFLLPLIQVLWVNAQGIFILGPILLGFALLDAALGPGAWSKANRGWWRKAGLASALTCAACLINPYGIEGALFPLALTRTMGSPIFQRSIAELKPIFEVVPRLQEAFGWPHEPINDFVRFDNGVRNVMLMVHFATLALGALSFIVPWLWSMFTPSAGATAGKGKPKKGKRNAKDEGTWRPSLFRVLVFLAFSWLGLQANRNSHQFAAVVGAITAWNLAEWAAVITARRRSTRNDPTAHARSAAPRAVAFASIAVAFVAVASGAFYQLAGEGRVVGLGFEPLWFPHKAVQFAGRPEMPERFVSFSFGWASLYDYYFGPKRKVFIDPRLEVAGPELYERNVELEGKLRRDDPGWSAELVGMGKPIVLIGHAGLSDPGEMAGTGAALLGHPDWKLIYFDPQASIYVHKDHEDIVRKYAVDLRARHFQPDPDGGRDGEAALLASARSFWSLGTSLAQLGRPALVETVTALGLDHARRALRSNPEGPAASKLMALLLLLRAGGETATAPRAAEPFDPIVDLDTIRATAALRRARERKADDYLLTLGLFQAYLSQGLREAALPLLDELIARPARNTYQRAMRRGLMTQRSELVVDTAPLDPSRFRNRNELEQAMKGLLVAGRAGAVADLLEREFPAEARPWPLADRLATIRLHLGEPEHARAIWEGVANPPLPGVRAARVAFTYFVEEDFEAARRHYRDAIARDPALFEAHYGLARLEADARRARHAAESARKALENGPSEAARATSRALLNSVAPYQRSQENEEGKGPSDD